MKHAYKLCNRMKKKTKIPEIQGQPKKSKHSHLIKDRKVAMMMMMRMDHELFWKG